MLDILRFIFADGWHFFGSLLLLIVLVHGLAAWRPLSFTYQRDITNTDNSTDNSRHEQ